MLHGVPISHGCEELCLVIALGLLSVMLGMCVRRHYSHFYTAQQSGLGA